MSAQDKYSNSQTHLEQAVQDGAVTQEDADAITELCHTFNEARPTFSRPAWPDVTANLRQYRSLNTLANWTYQLTRIARVRELATVSTTSLNELWGEMLRGSVHIVDDDGISKGSIRAYQNTSRVFYRLHDQYNVEYDGISVFNQQETSVKPADMLTSEEVDQVRQTPNNPRDKAIVYLLLYTGMRNTALRTLRVKDIEFEPEARYYFNTTADGLKGISRPEQPRPLLGAESAVRTWLNFHPTNNPDDYLLTARPSHTSVNPSTALTSNTISRTMRSVKSELNIQKPLHPHAMRHNFVSICKREYGMDDDAVKFLIGHSPDSTVMSTTYAHLSGEDYAQKAEVAAGIRDETESSLTPEEYCDACGEPLPDRAKACPSCGTTFTPDARSAKRQALNDINTSMVDAFDKELRKALADLDTEVRENVDIETLIDAINQD